MQIVMDFKVFNTILSSKTYSLNSVKYSQYVHLKIFVKEVLDMWK